jgi:hypothetical protein
MSTTRKTKTKTGLPQFKLMFSGNHMPGLRTVKRAPARKRLVDMKKGRARKNDR